jgi:hypothetical protein
MSEGKPCFKCQTVKPLTEFYKHPKMADGHLGKCKSCTKKDVTEHRNAKLEEVRAYDRARWQNPERRAANKQRRRTPEWRAYEMRRQAERRRLEPDKYRAWGAVSNALRRGKLVKQPCEICGSTTVEAHHEDYSRPLDVHWLCQEHHRTHGHKLPPSLNSSSA